MGLRGMITGRLAINSKSVWLLLRLMLEFFKLLSKKR